VRRLALGGVGLWLAGCQTFVEINTQGNAPVFNWRTDAPVTGLTVVADEDCEMPGGGNAYGDRIMWRLEGKLTPPVVYGKVPPGVMETAHARPFPASCKWWTVTLTDGAMQGESTKFRW
jgi:hypothetical protein